MKARSVILVTGLVVILMTGAAQGQNKRGPSTADERAQAVRLAHALESDPLSDDAKAGRAWLARFWDEVPDIGVKVCTNFFSPLLKEKKNYASEIFLQMMFSQGAFMIEHPDKAGEDNSTYRAGVEGMLKTYDSILKVKPKAKWPFLDDLLQKRESGTLEAWVNETTKKCGQP